MQLLYYSKNTRRTGLSVTYKGLWHRNNHKLTTSKQQSQIHNINKILNRLPTVNPIKYGNGMYIDTTNTPLSDSASKDTIAMDGNTSAAYIAFANSETSFISPSAPTMSVQHAMLAFNTAGKTNCISNRSVSIENLNIEAGVTEPLYKSLTNGVVCSTFAAPKYLSLMAPTMNQIARELLPSVMHVYDYSDIMIARRTRYYWAVLCSSTVQEAMDLSLISHLATFKSRIPFIHFYDSNRIAYEINRIHCISYEDINQLINHDSINEHLKSYKRTMRQRLVSTELFYEDCTKHIESIMIDIELLTGRRYNLFDYFGHPQAENILVTLGNAANVTEQFIKSAIAINNEKIGLIKVRCYLPWNGDNFLSALPKTAQTIGVLERTIDQITDKTVLGNPLFLDVQDTVQQSAIFEHVTVTQASVGAINGNITPETISVIFDNLNAKNLKPQSITLNTIKEPVSYNLNTNVHDLSLSHYTKQCIFWGLGSDGTIAANKETIQLLRDYTNIYCQGFFTSDSKRSGVTCSQLRFGPEKIQAPFDIASADYIAIHHSYPEFKQFARKFDLLQAIKPNGIFVLNSPMGRWGNKMEFDAKLPASMKRQIASNDVQFYNIDATEIANDVGLKGSVNAIMQFVFYQLCDIIPEHRNNYVAVESIIKRWFGTKGTDVVNMYIDAIDQAAVSLKKIDYPKDRWMISTDDHKPLTYTGKPEYAATLWEPWMLYDDTLTVTTFERKPSDVQKMFPSTINEAEKTFNEETLDTATKTENSFESFQRLCINFIGFCMFVSATFTLTYYYIRNRISEHASVTKEQDKDKLEETNDHDTFINKPYIPPKWYNIEFDFILCNDQITENIVNAAIDYVYNIQESFEQIGLQLTPIAALIELNDNHINDQNNAEPNSSRLTLALAAICHKFHQQKEHYLWKCSLCSFRNEIDSANCALCSNTNPFIYETEQQLNLKNVPIKSDKNDNFSKSHQKQLKMNDVSDKCDSKNEMDIRQCMPFKRLKSLITNMSQPKFTIDNVNIAAVIDDFLFLSTKYSDDDTFQDIYNALNVSCDITKCNIIKRAYANRKNGNELQIIDTESNNAKTQILDKIHCYYMHSFDIGYRLSFEEKLKFQDIDHDMDDMKEISHNIDFTSTSTKQLYKLISNKQQQFEEIYNIIQTKKYSQLNASNFCMSEENIYNFGSKFVYEGDTPNDVEQDDEEKYVKIKAKFSCLKEELLNNSISVLSIGQYDTEWRKVLIHYDSRYRKTNYSDMLMEHLLALMVYCNFDGLQHNFSETYRIDIKRHESFHHLGFALKTAVHEFGNDIQNTNLKQFYHGIGKMLVLPSYISNVRIYCPLSTSSSFEVAMNFTNNNEGMIINFGAGRTGIVKYFATSWLSDYSNENECLFIQNQWWSLQINNIIHVKSGTEFRIILKALNILDRLTTGNAIYDQSYWQLIGRIINNNMDGCHQYAQALISTYCNNKKTVKINYLKINTYTNVRQLLFCFGYEWIKINVFNVLFPKLECIVVENIVLCRNIFEDIFYHLSNANSKTIVRVIILAKKQTELSVDDAIKQYEKRFANIQYGMRKNYRNRLFIEAMIYEQNDKYEKDEKNMNEEKELIATVNECCICMDREKEVAFQPCGHYIACEQCAIVLKNDNGTCAVCNRKIRSVLRIYDI
eukprot:189308_1